MSHVVAPFKRRLRDALESDSLPMALGRVLPLLDGRRREAFHGRDFPAEQARLAAIRRRDVADGPRLLQKFTATAEKAGMVVHPPADAAAVRETVAALLRGASARMVVKSKSMATEEIGLRQALEADGLEVIETDLGEFLVQAADELPSHIVAPALHITRERAAELIGSVTGQKLPSDPDTLVRAAREYLRDKFIAADAGITGANALVASTAAAQTWNCPTLSTNNRPLAPGDVDAFVRRFELRLVPPETRQAWAHLTESVPDRNPQQERCYAIHQTIVKALSDADAPLLLGTDAWGYFMIPGFAIHEELWSFVNAGLTPFQALRAATSEAGRYLRETLGFDEDVGVVRPGARADLLLLNANPLLDVANVVDRAGVMLRGRWVPETELADRLADLAAAYQA